MLGWHHRGILKQALANGGIFHPVSRGQHRSLATLRDLELMDSVEGASAARGFWVLTRKGVSWTEDMITNDKKVTP